MTTLVPDQMSDASDKAIAALIDLTRIFTGEFELDEALVAIVETALTLVSGDHASVRLLNADQTELLAGARAGQGANAKAITFRPGEGVIGWVADTGEVARINDVANDPRFKVVPHQGYDVASLLVIPMMTPEGVIGVLGITSSRIGAFEEEHELLARLVANCAVPPIEKARLSRMALTDDQTRMFNRRFLMPRLELELERCLRHELPLSLLLIDLDDFKSVNDTWGHAVGDQVLSAVADRLRKATRSRDLLVRRGGDEFVVILPETDADNANRAAQRIIEAVSGTKFTPGDIALGRTVSVGIATWDRRETAHELERRADIAMYEAKTNGGDCASLAPMPAEARRED